MVIPFSGFRRHFFRPCKSRKAESISPIFYFLACLIVAPEVIITNKQSQVVTLEQIIADARQKQGRQIWVGPGVGGLDHLMAVKTWEKLGISATWIPYNGGGEAIAALLGGHGVVYVGNPEDLRGRPDLVLAASATDKRLPEYPQVPTFIDKGYHLSDEVMWRGFAVRKETPAAILRYLVELLRQVSRDKEWQSFVAANSAEAVFIENAAFSQRVKHESRQVRKYLSKAGILPEKDRQRRSRSWLVLTVVIAVVAGSLAAGLRLTRQKLSGELVIIAATVVLAIFFYYRTFSFPQLSKAEIVSTATVPRLWSLALLFLGLQGIYLAWRGKLKTCAKQPGSVGRAIATCGLLIAYVSLLEITGFLVTTGALLLSGIYVMGYRRHLIAVLVTALVLAFMYVAFIRILQVPLPTGNLW